MKEVIIKTILGILLIIGGFLVLFNVATGRCEAAENWRQVAEMYDSNYPGVDNNAKAKMFMKNMDNNNVHYNMEIKEHLIQVIYVYDDSGRTLWPVIRNKEEEKYNQLELLAIRAKELDKIMNNKKSKDTTCTTGSCSKRGN